MKNYPEINEDDGHSRRIRRNGEFDVTFQEFVRYVSDTANRLTEPPEEHWREIDRLCSPCSIHYDVIGKMETLENDTHYILKRSGADEVVGKLGKSTNPTNSSKDSKIRDAFAQLTEKDLNLFERRFQKDLDLFDYQRPKAITKSKSEEEDRREKVEKLRTVTLKHPAPGERINIDINKINKMKKSGRPTLKNYFPEEIRDEYGNQQSELRRRDRRRDDRFDNRGNRFDNGGDRIRDIEDQMERHKQQLLNQIRHETRLHDRESSMDEIPEIPRDRFRRFGRRMYRDDSGPDRFHRMRRRYWYIDLQ